MGIEGQEELIKKISIVINNYYYQHKPIDDQFVFDIFDVYIEYCGIDDYIDEITCYDDIDGKVLSSYDYYNKTLVYSVKALTESALAPKSELNKLSYTNYFQYIYAAVMVVNHLNQVLNYKKIDENDDVEATILRTEFDILSKIDSYKGLKKRIECEKLYLLNKKFNDIRPSVRMAGIYAHSLGSLLASHIKDSASNDFCLMVLSYLYMIGYKIPNVQDGFEAPLYAYLSKLDRHFDVNEIEEASKDLDLYERTRYGLYVPVEFLQSINKNREELALSLKQE